MMSPIRWVRKRRDICQKLDLLVAGFVLSVFCSGFFSSSNVRMSSLQMSSNRKGSISPLSAFRWKIFATMTSCPSVRELRAISHSDRKSDQVDAEKLARYARLDPNILCPIANRTVEQQQAPTLIRARALLVRLRTAAVNAVRGLTKSCGYRMPASATTCFAQRSLAVMPPGLAQALGPVLQQIAEMTVKIKLYDRQIQQLDQTEYPETQALLKVHGVGHLTALTFVLTLVSK